MPQASLREPQDRKRWNARLALGLGLSSFFLTGPVGAGLAVWMDHRIRAGRTAVEPDEVILAKIGGIAGVVFLTMFGISAVLWLVSRWSQSAW